MKNTFIVVGKTLEKYLQEGEKEYIKRLKHYCSLDFILIPELKNTKKLSHNEIKVQEGDKILQKIKGSDYVVLLDEKGKDYSSIQFSKFLEKMQHQMIRNCVFIVGGPYGFSDAVYQRANQKLSLSKMTFSHQMVRLFFLEQLYRAYTIMKNEPYHHE